MKKRQTSKRLPLLLSLTAMLSGSVWPSIMAEPAAVYAQDSDAIPDCEIILDPGSAGAMQGRQFEFYRVLGARFNSDRTSVDYFFEPGSEKALKNAVAKMKSCKPSDLTLQSVLDYLETLRSQAQGTPESSASAFRTFVETLRPELMKNGAVQTRVTVTSTDSKGRYHQTGLPAGWYLVNELQLTSTDPGNQAASLCLVDTLDGTPKVIELKNDLPKLTKKIEEDDHEVGWNDIGDYEAGQNIPFRLEAKVPQISAYSTYFMSFHDVMDEGLDFLPETLRCTLISGSRQIEIPKERYALITDSKTETFEVRFDDIKAFVDEQFPAKQSDGTRPYGQTVRAEFCGRINEKAFKPGKGADPQENTARLEFSNDARNDMSGSHSYTPWDTVVCFTYSLNGLKTDEKNEPLENAQFRLFTDEACTQKILVRKGSDGYIVLHEDELKDDPSARSKAVSIVSQKDGLFRIYGLDQGTYFLQETAAPDGYRRFDKPIELIIEPTFPSDRDSYEKGEKDIPGKILKKLKCTAKITDHYAGLDRLNTASLTTSVNPPIAAMTLINRTRLRLPLTGTNGALLAAGTGSLLVVGGMVLNMKSSRTKKKDRKTDGENR